ncbi:hypothetical protein R3P38DRAFT_2763625 [Favolaschia claudopus]|uniref:F-box domain-containing protein n=1 Tax=Favolaschia claudopus TaxID=2862362 RepID=A0AAW0DJJ0_9AGAR
MDASLPTEVFQAILLEVVDHRDPNENWVEIVDQRLTLSSVCRYWREVASGYTELWTAITVQRFTNHHLLCYCLEHCGDQRDMTITIDLGPWNATLKNKSMKSVKSAPLERFLKMIDEVLMPFANRIESITVKNETEQEIKMVTDLMAQYSWPRLRKLALRPSWNDGSLRRAFALPQHHRISHFHLRVASPRQFPLSVFASLHELTLQESHNGDWKAFDNIMRASVEIRCLRLDKVETTIPHPSRSVKMADTLHTLHFCYENPRQAGLLQGVDVGPLERLTVQAHGSSDLRQAISNNPSMFAHSRDISISQRNDDTRKGSLAALLAMCDVVHGTVRVNGRSSIERLCSVKIRSTPQRRKENRLQKAAYTYPHAKNPAVNYYAQENGFSTDRGLPRLFVGPGHAAPVGRASAVFRHVNRVTARAQHSMQDCNVLPFCLDQEGRFQSGTGLMRHRRHLATFHLPWPSRCAVAATTSYNIDRLAPLGPNLAKNDGYVDHQAKFSQVRLAPKSDIYNLDRPNNEYPNDRLEEDAQEDYIDREVEIYGLVDNLAEVPNETIARIFILTLRPVTSEEDIYQNELLRERLQDVCIKFRQVVDHLPVFWSFIMLETVNHTRPSPLDASELYANVCQHVSNSAPCPLHIAFDLVVVPNGRDESTRIWNMLLLPTVRRWTSLFFRGAGSCTSAERCVEDLLGPNVLAHATKLKIIDVAKKWSVSCSKKHERLPLVSNTFHTVRCAVLVDIMFAPSWSLQYLHVITDRDHRDMNWSAFFASCTNLKQLKWDKRHPLRPSNAVITIPSLDRLTLWTLAFLPPVFAPRLSRLEILDSSEPMTVELFVKLVGSAARFTTLMLPTNPVSNQGLLDILESCPYLEHLTASDVESRTRIFRFLARKLIYQYRVNSVHKLSAIKILLSKPMQENVYAQNRCLDLEDLCHPRECPKPHCLCFEPFTNGTCVVVSGLRVPLTESEVARVYSEERLLSRIGFKVPVLKVWVPERIHFGQMPTNCLTLVILLDLEMEKAKLVATLGFKHDDTLYAVDQLEATKSHFRSKILDQYFHSPYKACVPHIRRICDSPQLASSASNRALEGSTANLLEDFDCHGGALHIITGARCGFLTRVVKVETGSLKRPNTKLVVTTRRNSRPLLGRREKHSVLTLRCNLYRGTGPWLHPNADKCHLICTMEARFPPLFSQSFVFLCSPPPLAIDDRCEASQFPTPQQSGLFIVKRLLNGGRCHEVWYCSPEHNIQAWPEHRLQCRSVTTVAPSNTIPESLETIAEESLRSVQAIFFPVNEDYPRMIAIELRDHQDL